MDKCKMNDLEMVNKYYDIWNSIIECELEILEGNEIKERIMLEQILKVAQEKLKQYNK